MAAVTKAAPRTSLTQYSLTAPQISRRPSSLFPGCVSLTSCDRAIELALQTAKPSACNPPQKRLRSRPYEAAAILSLGLCRGCSLSFKRILLFRATDGLECFAEESLWQLRKVTLKSSDASAKCLPLETSWI